MEDTSQHTMVAKQRDAKYPGIGDHFVELQQRVEGIAVLPEESTDDIGRCLSSIAAIYWTTLKDMCDAI